MDFSEFNIPNEKIAFYVAEQLLGEAIFTVERIKHGSQNYVYLAKTLNKDFIIKLTTPDQRMAFESAIYWQYNLISLNIATAPFIACDIQNKISPFPALIMDRVQGKDLCDIYPYFSLKQKQHLALFRVDVEQRVKLLKNTHFGYTYGIKTPPIHNSWYDFCLTQVKFRKDTFNKYHSKDYYCDQVEFYTEKMKPYFKDIESKGFLWDVADRNILINPQNEAVIIDVEELCFGDSLMPLGLTYVSLEMLGYDLHYPDYWYKKVKDSYKELKVNYYRLFYLFWMIGRPTISRNGTIRQDNYKNLHRLFEEAVDRLESCFLVV